MMEYIPPHPPFQPYTYPQADPIPDSLLQVQLEVLARADPRFNFFTKSTLSPTELQFINRGCRIRVACLPAALPCPDMAAHTQPPQPDDPLAALLLPSPYSSSPLALLGLASLSPPREAHHGCSGGSPIPQMCGGPAAAPPLAQIVETNFNSGDSPRLKLGNCWSAPPPQIASKWQKWGKTATKMTILVSVGPPPKWTEISQTIQGHNNQGLLSCGAPIMTC